MKTQQTEIKGTYQDFIGSYSNSVDSQFCKDVIDSFEYYQNIGAVFCGDNQFEDSCAGRFDWSIDLTNMSPHMKDDASNYLNRRLQEYYDEYCHVFGTLKKQPMFSLSQKVQKTPTGGGYHVWHSENDFTMQSRCLVWMIYLNDDYDGGETEFLYYKKRIQPEKGKMLIWPAGYTHTHKGNMVLSGNKYVITGWFNYAR